MEIETNIATPRVCGEFAEIRDALSKAEEKRDGFVILKDGGRMIQTAVDAEGFVVEKSNGAQDPLYRASRNGSDKFALTDVEVLFRSWYDGVPVPPGVQWSEIDE